MVTFDVDPQVVFRLDEFDQSQDMAESVRAVQWQGGRTNIAAALKEAREQLFRNVSDLSANRPSAHPYWKLLNIHNLPGSVWHI